MTDSVADPAGVADWLTDLISSEVARDADISDFVVPIEKGKFALISPEGASVYVITVQEAHFTVASNQEGSP